MQPLFSICFLDHICNTTSKSCRNINFRISNKPNNNLTLWPKLIFQICTKLLSACFSSSTSTTVALQQVLSCYLHTPGSHQSSLLNRSESVSQSVREQVSDKGKQWLDSGPIKKSWAHLIKKSKWYVWQLVDIGQGSLSSINLVFPNHFHWLCLSLTDWLTVSLLFSKLD